MRKAVVYIIILAIVCTGFGVILGIAFCKLQARKRIPQIIQRYQLETSVEQRINGRYEQFMRNIGSRLNLTPEQKDKIHEIYKQIIPESEAVARKLNVDLSQIRSKVIAAIFEVLDPAQKAQFQSALERIQRRVRARNPKKME